MAHYDLAIIGTGSGNTILDDRFSGMKVAIIEEHLFGGTCTNVGCIPTKMYVYPADVAREARRGPELGVDTSYDGARWADIRDRIFGRVDHIEQAGRRYRKRMPNVDVYESHCTFADDHTLLIHGDGPPRQITADRIVIAAGSRVDVAPIPGLDEVGFETSDTVMRLPDLPRRMAIVGGGFVAAEFAHVFSALGTDVTLVHRGDRLLRKEDETVATAYTRAASAQWQVRLSTTVTSVATGSGGPVLTLSDGSELETDVLLVATGRSSNADRLGLENTGILVEDGIVVVDEYQRTSVEGVLALGDVANHWQLKHVANAEARVVRHNLLFPGEPVAADHRHVPRAVFSSPQVASVGLTTQEARDAGRRAPRRGPRLRGDRLRMGHGERAGRELRQAGGRPCRGVPPRRTRHRAPGQQPDPAAHPGDESGQFGQGDGARAILDPPGHGRSRRKRIVENDQVIDAECLSLP